MKTNPRGGHPVLDYSGTRFLSNFPEILSSNVTGTDGISMAFEATCGTLIVPIRRFVALVAAWTGLGGVGLVDELDLHPGESGLVGDHPPESTVDPLVERLIGLGAIVQIVSNLPDISDHKRRDTSLEEHLD